MTSSTMPTGIKVLIVVMIFILAGGIIFLAGNFPASQPLQNTQVTTCSPDRECPPGTPVALPRGNLTLADAKLSTDLLQLMGRKDLPAGMTRGMLEQQMEQNRQVTHATGTGETLVYVYVQTTGTADLALLTPYVWNITSSDPAHGLVVAWVDAGKLEKLASLEPVRTIRTVSPPTTRGG